ncbi:hypothetical protein HDU92_000689 [Lobulomyces angularis]|nr:hypothetical protein HDU92_000689 [Lobulomyces angularis]
MGSSSSKTVQVDVLKFVDNLVLNDKIVLFSKSYCGYCRSSKKLLNELNLKFTTIELDNRSDGQDIQTYLFSKTQQTSVPNIFIGGNHIGGNDKLHKIFESGELKKILANLKIDIK